MNNKKQIQLENTAASNTNPLELIKNLKFCIFDLETTGGNHKSDKIIEIGLVKIEKLEIVEEKNFLINPEIKIPEFIQKLTSIKQADVEQAPCIEDVINEILDFMGDRILVAHNTSFDVPFFNSVLKRLNIEELQNKSICTNLMTKYLIPNLLNSNLNYMSKIFNIPHKEAHRALDDARATAFLLQTYLKIFIDKGIQKINHLYYPRNRYELDRIHFKCTQENHSQKTTEQSNSVYNKIKQIHSPFLITIKGENGVILFALPCEGKKEEVELIHQKLNHIDWKITTIKLFGPFIESLIHFNNFFCKLENNVRREVITFLWRQHLPNVNQSQLTENEISSPLIDKEFGDFIITNHLVPEQMIIYPIQSLSLKNQLIFRHSSHQKKLLQYINSKSSRISNNKLNKHYFHPLLEQFVEHYLLKGKKENSNLFIFKKKIPINQPEEFFKQLNQFLTQNPNSYKYPKEYI